MQVALWANGVELQGKIFEDSYTLTRSSGSVIDVAKFNVDDKDNSVLLNKANTIVVEKDGDPATRLFGGIVASKKTHRRGLGRVFSVVAQDWTVLLDRATVTKDYRNQTDLAIIKDAFKIAGKTQFALSFDGIDDILTIPDATAIQNVFDGGGAISLAVRPGVFPPSSDGTIAAKLSGTSGWALSIRSDGKIDFTYNFSTTAGVWRTDATDLLETGDYHRITIVYNADDVGNDPTIYVDRDFVARTEVQTPVGTRTSDAGIDLTFGDLPSGTQPLNADLDDIRLHDENLIQLDVRKYLFQRVPLSESNLIGYWRLQEGEGTEVQDATQNNNDGTITGASWTEDGCDVWGIRIGSETKASGKTIEDLALKGQTLRSLMDSLIQISGFSWNVTPKRKLVHRSARTQQASFGLSDNPDNVATFPFYGNPRRNEELGNFNAVEVVGATELSSDKEQVSSGDGTRTVWHIHGGTDDFTETVTHAPSTADRVIIERNTGTDGSPVWTAQDVGLEGQDTLGVVEVLWNPLIQRVEWNSAPPNFANSWRITGRYKSPLIVRVTDEDAIDNLGFEFTKSLMVPEIQDQDTAIDVAFAFLKEQGDQDTIMVSFNQDGLDVDEAIAVTAAVWGLTGRLYLVNELSTAVLGGLVNEYTASLIATPNIQVV